jgi:hypothetical protein
MTDQPPQRVRVTGPPRRQRPYPPAGDLDEDTRLGGVYFRSLLREQLWLALRIVALLALSVGSLPLVFQVVPGLSEVGVFGIPLPWLLLGVVVYPVLGLLGWRYVLRAERNERDYADLVLELRAHEEEQ